VVGFDSIARGDSAYPTLLTLIPDPPERLFFRGNLAALEFPAIAIVGSRKSTEYGRWAARTLAKRLSEHGIAVVSGMADGIDTYAHKGALEEKTPTIAVFGCGLDFCFPKGNRGLMEQICENGLILSEYPAGTAPTRFTFPRRNRIISGLSFATVVVEAGFSSGSLITAEKAAEQGREVYAVPGNINRMGSVGSNKLIADGARPLVFIDDILADFGLCAKPAEKITEEMNSAEKKVFAAVLKNGEISYEKLAAEVGISLGEAVSIATVLEMKGCVNNSAGRVFVAE